MIYYGRYSLTLNQKQPLHKASYTLVKVILTPHSVIIKFTAVITQGMNVYPTFCERKSFSAPNAIIRTNKTTRKTNATALNTKPSCRESKR